MSSKLIKIALDPGFGGFKVAFINGRGPVTTVLPSVVGAGSIRDVAIGTGLGRGRTFEEPHQVHLDGVTYLVGHNVHRHTRPIERLDFDRLADGPELKALVYTALYQALGGGKHRIALLIGMPVEVLQDRSLAASTRARLSAWLVGDHCFTVNGDQVTLTVEQVKTMAQPLGSFFAWGINERGEWIQSDDPLKMFAVGDVGFNTLDPFVIEGARISKRYTGGDKLGMRRANSVIRTTVRQTFGVELSFYEADGYMRAYLAGQPVILGHSGGDSDLGQIIRQGLDENFGEIATFLEEIWGNGRQFRRVIFSGGGAEALRPQLLGMYPQAIILPNAQTANAEGLAKYAQRANVFGE